MALSDSAVLDLWERAHRRGPVARAVALAAAGVSADASGETFGAPPAEEWTLGERDVAILRLRRALFGGALPMRVACPACAAALEFDVDVDALVGALPPPSARTFEIDGWNFRLPDSRDVLLAARTAREPAAVARAMVSRCRVDRAGDAANADPEEDPRRDVVVDDAFVARVGARMEALDPGASLSFALVCAACGIAWQAEFDPAAFVFEELRTRAGALLDEVDVLARAYGWSEPEVLALSPARRAAYLDRCAA